MSTFLGLCRGTKLAAVLSVPIFGLLFFTPYWFLLTPVICCKVIKGSRRDTGLTPALSSWWFIGYWLTSGILSLVVLAVVYWYHRRNPPPPANDTEEASGEFLFNWRRNRSTESLVPLTLKSRTVQPLEPTEFPVLRKKTRVSELQSEASSSSLLSSAMQLVPDSDGDDSVEPPEPSILRKKTRARDSRTASPRSPISSTPELAGIPRNITRRIERPNIYSSAQTPAEGSPPQDALDILPSPRGTSASPGPKGKSTRSPASAASGSTKSSKPSEEVELSWDENVPWVSTHRTLELVPESPTTKDSEEPESSDPSWAQMRKERTAGRRTIRSDVHRTCSPSRNRSSVSLQSTLSLQTIKPLDPTKIFGSREQCENAELSTSVQGSAQQVELPLAVTLSVVQPPVKCLSPLNPSETELSWEEDVPWTLLRRKLERVSGSPSSYRSAVYKPLDDSLFVLRNIFEGEVTPEVARKLPMDETTSTGVNEGSYAESESDAGCRDSSSMLSNPFDYAKLEVFREFLRLTPNISPCSSPDSAANPPDAKPTAFPTAADATAPPPVVLSQQILPS